MTTPAIARSLAIICRAAGIDPETCDPDKLETLREAVADVMRRSYLQGSDDHYRAVKAAEKRERWR